MLVFKFQFEDTVPDPETPTVALPWSPLETLIPQLSPVIEFIMLLYIYKVCSLS